MPTQKHGMKGAKHCFLEAGNGCELSFVEFPKSSFRGKVDQNSVGHQHHCAFRCTSMEHFHRLHAQIKQHARISAPIDHGFCTSAYFNDPINGFALEITVSTRDYKPSDYDLSLLKRWPDSSEDLFSPDFKPKGNASASPPSSGVSIPAGHKTAKL